MLNALKYLEVPAVPKYLYTFQKVNKSTEWQKKCKSVIEYYGFEKSKTIIV